MYIHTRIYDFGSSQSASIGENLSSRCSSNSHTKYMILSNTLIRRACVVLTGVSLTPTHTNTGGDTSTAGRWRDRHITHRHPNPTTAISIRRWAHQLMMMVCRLVRPPQSVAYRNKLNSVALRAFSVTADTNFERRVCRFCVPLRVLWFVW